ncbi:MAG: galactokinase [bacterium]
MEKLSADMLLKALDNLLKGHSCSHAFENTLLEHFQNNYDYRNHGKIVMEGYKTLVKKYKELYNRDEMVIARAPGRINLIGEHTDYNGCPVLPMAVNRDIVAAFYPTNNNEIILSNIDADFSPRRFDIDIEIPPYSTGDWGNYCKAGVQGILDYFKEKGKSHSSFKGMEIMLWGNIPKAAGMSSSSAFVVISALMFLYANELAMDKQELAQLMARAEHYVGTQGGGMDQATSLLGRRAHALKIDFKPFHVTPALIPPGYSIVVSNSMVHAAKTEGAMDNYNTRAIECRLAAAILKQKFSELLRSDSNISLLGDLNEHKINLPEDKIWEISDNTFHEEAYSLQEISGLLQKGSKETAMEYCMRRDRTILPEPSCGFKLFQRYKHITTEWKRVEKSLDAFKTNDMFEFGKLMDASHRSCSGDFEISCPELDILTDLARKCGALGSRLTGAGFGGCAVSLVREDQAEIFIEKMIISYYRDYLKLKLDGYSDLIFPCRAVDGADILFNKKCINQNAN